MLQRCGSFVAANRLCPSSFHRRRNPLLSLTTLHPRVFCFVAVSVLGLFAMASPASASDPSKPNVVFILVDDMGYHDLSATGSTFYETPHIDDLMAGAATFDRGYAACRVCSPSRASILTGKFPARHGITQFIGGRSGSQWKRGDPLLPADYVRELPASDITLAETLRENGYQTFFAGKWHLGGEGSLPTDHGFDINVAGHERGSPPGGFFTPYKNPFLDDGPPGESLTLRLGRETADFVGQDHERPFFAMLCFYAVHAPIQTTPDLWQKYQAKWAEDHPGQPADYERFRVDETWAVRQVQDNPIYAGMVESTDRAVGMVIDALKSNGQFDNTIICFTSDNGGVSSGDAYATSNLPLRGGKGRPHEGGIREPYAIAYPGKIASGSFDAIATGTDWYPTILDYCGIEANAKQHIDGVSLRGVLEGSDPVDRPLFFHYPHYDNQGGSPSSIIIRDRWKLIHFYEDDRVELYKLDVDPSESSNVARAYPNLSRSMLNELDEFLNSVGAKFPEPNPNYDPAGYENQNRRRQTSGLERLEKQHANYLDPKFEPNPTWWGAKPKRD